MSSAIAHAFYNARVYHMDIKPAKMLLSNSRTRDILVTGWYLFGARS